MTVKYTWTDTVNRCRSCGDRFRVSVEALGDAWKDAAADDAKRGDPLPTIEDIANSIEFCLECVTDPAPGEKEGLGNESTDAAS